MKFLEKVQSLRDSYDIHDCEIQETVALYGINHSPNPYKDHVIFSPMSEGQIQFLLDSYAGTIPQDLLTIYRAMNGAHMFSTPWSLNVKGETIYLSTSHLSLYGIPLTNTRDRYEPYNISLEDAASPEGTPMNWLKFGSYHKLESSANFNDLFVDTDTGKVYAQEHDDLQCTVIKSWESIDECLCDLFDFFSEHLYR